MAAQPWGARPMPEPFSTQSEAWRRGYAWAGDLSEGKDTIDDAIERYGYDFDTPEFHDFLNGAEVKQTEQMGDQFGYDFYDEDQP